MELRCSVMKYDWGELGRKSLVARLAEKNDPLFEIDESTPYAEFWMGTHPNGPSVLKVRNKPLNEYIQDNPSCVGNSISSFGADLPFLLKVLSIRKALSIQVHPNKEDAQTLHLKYPKMYTDNNHKPELAVALNDFEALCGFRPLEEIADFLKSIPELCSLVNPEHRYSFIKQPSIKLLELCFSSYITASPVECKRSVAQIIERWSQSDFKLKEVQLEKLFLRLNKQFPEDIGLFSIYFLNYITLKPGEAIFLDAGLPHAYLHGNCVEVMARSDNVVRAGLTPKVRDVATLLNIIKYRPTSIENLKFYATYFDKFMSVYKPPISDFALARICLSRNQSYTLPVLKTASLLIVINGTAENEYFDVEPGVALFIPTEYIITFNVTSDTLEMYQAHPNL
uniref:mannose-6-phosphate isomerase n=1 Tax=Panstrongylus megistus TaxID=65343 RepID=A0A069DYV5_9HEMI